MVSGSTHVCTFIGHVMGSVIGTVIIFCQNINLPLFCMIITFFLSRVKLVISNYVKFILLFLCLPTCVTIFTIVTLCPIAMNWQPANITQAYKITKNIIYQFIIVRDFHITIYIISLKIFCSQLVIFIKRKLQTFLYSWNSYKVKNTNSQNYKPSNRIFFNYKF